MASKARSSLLLAGLTAGATVLAVSSCGRGRRGTTQTGAIVTTAADLVADTGETGGLDPQVAPPETIADTPMPALRTGVVEPTELAAIPGKLVAYTQDPSNGYEYLEFHLERQSGHSGYQWSDVTFDPPSANVLAATERGMFVDAHRLMIRRPLVGARPQLQGALIGWGWNSGRRTAVRVPFTLDTAPAKYPGATRDPETRTRFATVMAAQLDEWSHPWAKFVAGRLPAAIAGKPLAPRKAQLDNTRNQRTDLTRLMDTTSGVLSMQEALQYDRGLRVLASPEPATIDITTVTGPVLDAHPFDAMRAELPGAPNLDVAKLEPLTRAAPADFWYARFADIRLMLRLLDEADTWITPVVQVFQQNPEDRKLASRYQAQLGLRRTGLARALGHTVVSSVAVVGSDPYLREGSDVTLIFAVKQQTIFDHELAGHLDAYRQEFPGLTVETIDHHGTAITVAKDPSGRVRQHRASIDGLSLVSNSMAAISRVLDAHAGRVPALVSEPDLHYMLARDPGTHDAFAFLGDRFIGQVVGPKQKILAARRQVALAELLSPGYAALLYGWLYEHQPATVDELLTHGVLAKGELAHGDGAAIAFSPGSAARSTWGSPDALTPLIDLPALTQVTPAEKAAYERFVRSYQSYWKRFIDPVAIRLDVRDEAGGQAIADIDVRILPLISASDYNTLAEQVGDARVSVPQLTEGLMGVWSVAPDAQLRGELNRLLRRATGKHELGLDWLGGWVAAGVEDRTSLIELLSWLDTTVQKRAERDSNLFEDDELWRRLGKFPGFVAAEVQNPAPLVATLAGLKAMVNDVAPGVIEWEGFATHGEVPIVRIRMNPKMPMLLRREQAEAVAIYYALIGPSFVASPNPETIKRMIDRFKTSGPKTLETGGAQFVLQGRSGNQKPILTALLWMLQGQANETQAAAREAAQIILRATGKTTTEGHADFERLARNYLGSVPLTAHGDHRFELTTTGTGDPVQGTKARPIYGELPYPDSPIQVLVQRLSGFRTEVSFDREPRTAGENARSLHTHMEIRMGPQTP